MSDPQAKAATDARTAPVAVWQILEKLRGQDLLDWRLAEISNRASVEERNLDIGFPFGWYAIELSAKLAVGEVRPLRYFARDLAMWRGEPIKVDLPMGKYHQSDADGCALLLQEEGAEGRPGPIIGAARIEGAEGRW